MPVCRCGKVCINKQVLSSHQGKCTFLEVASAETHRLAQRELDATPEPPLKRARVDASPAWMRPLKKLSQRTSTRQQEPLEDAHQPSQEFNFHVDTEILGGPAEVDSAPQDAPENSFTTSRRGRRLFPTWKVLNSLPEEPGDATEAESCEEDTGTPSLEDSPTRPVRRVVLLLTDYVRTVTNTFGLRRFYKRRPHRPPKAHIDLEACYAPTANAAVASRTPRTIADIIFPFPNLSSWRFSWHYARGYKKTLADQDDMKATITAPDFVASDLVDTNFHKINEVLAAGESEDVPWANEREGWRTSTITIGIPTGQKSTQASRRSDAAAQRRINRHETASDTPAEHAIPGHHFGVEFHHKNLCEEIKKTFSSDPAARDFVLDPHLVEHVDPLTGKAEQVFGELYNSQAFVDEDLRLQNSPPEPDCTLERAIVALMFWSDATVVSQFGQMKAWPGYMFYGNQSKYTRARPTARAARHIAFFPALPDRIQDFIRERNDGKPASGALLTHCRRELFHAAWEMLLDDEFVEAYKHGIVVDCIDGVRRRLYPRIFTYSADYPEKVLLATIRDQGRCPCPRCLTKFPDIPALGTSKDRDARTSQARPSSVVCQQKVADAREIIYRDGYVVTSEHVEKLLQEESLVPVKNVFAQRLGDLGFDIQKALVVDQLHEFELGVWKSLFTHLVRILESAGADLVHELNRRFRQVPSFAWSTVRKFVADVCAMKHMAARDFENILKCIIPCFEGLLPEAHNDAILTLLFVSAYWHALAKMRMHTEASLALLDSTTTVLGCEIRCFSQVTCAAFPTRETQKEYDARKRAEARRQQAARAPNPTPTSNAQPTVLSTSGRRLRTFNPNTIKLHFLGDYCSTIKAYGSTDSYSTQTGELEHRRVKARWQRTNNIGPEQQVINLDARETRMYRMANELQEHGVAVRGLPSHQDDVRDPRVMQPSKHHRIAVSQKNPVTFAEWNQEHPDDPAVQTFIPLLKDHLRRHFVASCPALENDDIPIILQNDRIFEHATAHINYTTYDLQRDCDIIHPSAHKADVLVYTPGVASDGSSISPFPWMYARVLGIYHANIILPGTTVSQRANFFHVRWFQTDPTHISGTQARRLERIQFMPPNSESGEVFGFVDPGHIIRACHLIPAFHYGRTFDCLGPSMAREAIRKPVIALRALRATEAVHPVALSTYLVSSGCATTTGAVEL
ncbi:hypothetical protein LXA43DRAFT_923997 [Ganoderma leucocontextum]|nr:hypothetical protein LXA43DRAFT_923997 [Ganoderma leucocontextum]